MQHLTFNFTKSFVNIVQPKVSRDQPANISPQINLYPGLSRSETVICSPKVKPNNLPHAEHLKNDNVPVGDLVRSPVEQIFEEHSYLKTGTSSISSSNTPSMTQKSEEALANLIIVLFWLFLLFIAPLMVSL